MKPKAAGGPRAARAGALGFTILALALTALTAFLLSRVFGEGKYATEPLADVVVAARELPAAEIIKEDDIKVVQWPQSTIPEGAFRSRDQVLGPKPRVPVVSLLPGEAIVARRLSSPEAGTGMASRVPVDKRGFPIRVDNWIADAKLVYPGAVVDLIATVDDPIEHTPITKTVLQRLTVLAVNGHVDVGNAGDEKDKNNDRRSDGAVVTVLVTPGEAEVLALAAREGKLDVALRNANDAESVTTQGTNPFLLTGRPYPGTGTQAVTVAVPQPVATPPGRRNPTPPAEMRRARETPPEEFAPQPAGSTQTIRIGGK